MGRYTRHGKGPQIIPAVLYSLGDYLRLRAPPARGASAMSQDAPGHAAIQLDDQEVQISRQRTPSSSAEDVLSLPGAILSRNQKQYIY